MPATKSRYDGHADWYDGWNQPHIEANVPEILDLLGDAAKPRRPSPGPSAGLCLDLGCGTGLYFDALTASGRTVVGLDRSADQLRIAQRRSRHIMQGDAARLPFADGIFPAVVTLWISTDVDDYPAVQHEAARVLAPGGILRLLRRSSLLQRPAQPDPRRRRDTRAPDLPPGRLAPGGQPWWGPYVRSRVGMRHHPLAELLNAFIAAELTIERVVERGDNPVPTILGIRARKPAGPGCASQPG